MSTQKHCDKCGFSRQRVDGSSAVVRYTLRREVDQTRPLADGRRAQRYQQSAGGIDLCDDCWESICKPRTNPNKGRARLREIA
jgi:hypothetical protein